MLYLPIGGGAEGRGGSSSGKKRAVELMKKAQPLRGGPKARVKPGQLRIAVLHLV